jgi:prevent-host-death family protein
MSPENPRSPIRNDHDFVVMKAMSVSDFKRDCTRVLREVSLTGEKVVITKRAKPIAEVSPSQVLEQHPAWGALSGSVEWMAPEFDEPEGDENWDAAR